MFKRFFILGILSAVMITSAFASNILSNYSLKPYGSVRFDAIYDNSGASGGGYLIYSTDNSRDSRQFRMLADATRIGLDIKKNSGDIFSKIEADFLSGNAYQLRLRHAYVKADFKGFEVLAGQTWHLTPLEFPGILNSYVMGNSGCLWQRVPQLRLTFPVGEKAKIAFAAVRPTTSAADDVGTASGIPGVQANITANFSGVRLTLSGAYGQKRDAATNLKAKTNLLALGYNIPIGILTLNGQIWIGKNLTDFLGGLGHMGYDSMAVRSRGGFANLKIQPKTNYFFNFGYGQDNPSDDKLNNGERIKNETMYGNINIRIKESILTSLEAARNITHYKVAAGADRDRRATNRFQMRVMHNF